MAAGAESHQLLNAVALLGAAVVAVPLFRWLGLGSVLGYLCAGLVVGPFGFALFADPEAILHFAELGVVMFLFVIGLEMRPSHLWGLRRQIFGLGALQIGSCSAALTAIAWLFGMPLAAAFVGATGFVLTSTAIVMQLLAERGDIAQPRGQKIVSVLLFEDLLIVPLLAVVALMSPLPADTGAGGRAAGILIAAMSLAALVAAGLYLLNPLFRLLAKTGAREVMTAAALLVVLGAALLMDMGGLSTAMGAFLAGVLLSESTFRHQLETDIEPFRGLLLGLFFIAVGMALNLSVVAENWQLIALLVPAMMLAKALCIYLVARALDSSHDEALDRAVLMAQGGEFAFVLYAAASSAGVIDAPTNNNFTAVVVISMALTPLAVLALKHFRKQAPPSLDGIEEVHEQSGSVLIIGFGRFGQVMSQALLARDVDVTIIDIDVDRIRSATRFGFKLYYGDGTRLDVLRTAGAGQARAIAVCVDDRRAANLIVELATHNFTQAKLLVRSYDRRHSLELASAGVDYQVRETFESAVLFGEAALRELGVDPDEAAEIAAEVRRLDDERFDLEMAAGADVRAGMKIMRTNTGFNPQPTPFTPPRRKSQALNSGAEAASESPERTAD